MKPAQPWRLAVSNHDKSTIVTLVTMNDQAVCVAMENARGELHFKIWNRGSFEKNYTITGHTDEISIT